MIDQSPITTPDLHPKSEVNYGYNLSMHPYQHLRGVYAAAVTPIRSDGAPDLEQLPCLLNFLAQRGCHGVLLLGTTGEGPSFSPAERLAILRAAQQARQDYPQLRLLAGTGTPSLQETIDLTRAAFEIGCDGVVVLPPYYYRKASQNGLQAWFDQLIHQAVPSGGALLAYHIPPQTGMDLSLDLLARLKDAHPQRFAGLKDSSGDPETARQLGVRFGEDLLVLTGNERLFSLALQAQASGCITAVANLLSPLLRQVWDAFLVGTLDEAAQARLSAGRATLDRYPPMPPLLKALLAEQHAFPRWAVRPPLLPLAENLIPQVQTEFEDAVA
ncbi:MAG: dihydrodipicolinate synthase family protein [Anaerolineales bacterium]|nr:dihydrodipicolinate synthase family protein [Anaerolineales bacterium]